MKKLVKGFCIAAAVLICLGIVFCIGGAAAGGTPAATGMLRDFGRRHGILYTTVYTLEPEKKIENFSTFGNTFDAKGIDNLRIEANAAEVEITEGDEIDRITVSVHGRKNDCDSDGTTLVIRNVRKDEKVIVEVPKDFSFDRVQITADTGKIAIESLRTDLLELELGAGTADIGNLTAKRADFELGAGEIIVNHGDVRSCEAEVDMGSFEYNGVLYDGSGHAECKAEIDMGSAVFRLEGKPTDYNYNVSCEIGTVIIGDQVYDATEESCRQGKNINNNAESTFEIECSVGDVTVEFGGGTTDEEVDKVL